MTQPAALTPKLRFPEFRKAPAWEPVSLRDASVSVDERVGGRKLTPVSISAGIGFVPQAEKFGRDISGNQYKLYTVVRDGDFVYNKGNSLRFPQGCIYQLRNWGEVAAPNVFICFRLKKGYSDGFFQSCFEKNTHGLQLKRHITSGARSNGLLNISRDTFFSVKIPTPSPAEQQKIAKCLSTLDELIGAESQKLDALKSHKKGLMQQLFPREGETIPRLRFPEFQSAPEWTTVALGDLLSHNPEYGVNAAAVPYSDSLPTYIRITDIDDDGRFLNATKASVDMVPTEENYLREGDIVLARTGASVGKSYLYKPVDGRLVFAGFLIRVRANPAQLRPVFLSYLLNTDAYWKWIAIKSVRSGQPGINGSEYASLQVPIPPDNSPALDEQQKIASCLSSHDELINAQSFKLEALRTYKQGLMQQLFPRATEVEA